MRPNKNSSREEILNYIKIYPLSFFHLFSDEPWAQPYIYDAVSEFAKENPKYFLELWANRFPHYINLALFSLESKNVAE